MVEQFTIHVVLASGEVLGTDVVSWVSAVLDDPVNATPGCSVTAHDADGWIAVVVGHPPMDLERQAALMRLAVDGIAAKRFG